MTCFPATGCQKFRNIDILKYDNNTVIERERDSERRGGGVRIAIYISRKYKFCKFDFKDMKIYPSATYE